MATNRLNYYNPVFYAQEALIWLRNRKGMFPRVYHAFENERNTFRLGDTINIRKPARFTATQAPNVSARQDLKTGTHQITLTNWKEVAFEVVDSEIAYGGERLITEHIGPAADALGDDLDQFLYQLALSCPHTFDFHNTAAADMPASFAAIRKLMVDNQVPQDGKPIHYMASPLTVQRSLSSSAFTQWQGAGEAGAQAQRSGTIDRKFGFDFFESQNGPAGLEPIEALVGTSPVTSGAKVKNDTTLTLTTTGTETATLSIGTVISVGGYQYSVTAAKAPSGGNWVDVPISPPLRDDVASGAAWALVDIQANVEGAYTADLAFHPNALAVCMVPLPMHAADMGARVFTATDAASGISVRARMAYDTINAKVDVALDMLYGGAMIDADLAVRPMVRAVTPS